MKQSKLAEIAYPLLQVMTPPQGLPSYDVEQEESFGYGCSAQTNGPSPALGASFLVSYPYMQYTNPNNSRYNPMDTMNFQDRSQIMQSINNLVVSNLAYDAEFQKQMQQDKAKYMRDVADVINKNETLKQLAKQYRSANPMAGQKTVVSQVPGAAQIVRKGGQDILVRAPPRTIVKSVDGVESDVNVEAFQKDVRSSASARVFSALGDRAMMAALVIVVCIFVFASRR